MSVCLGLTYGHVILLILLATAQGVRNYGTP